MNAQNTDRDVFDWILTDGHSDDIAAPIIASMQAEGLIVRNTEHWGPMVHQVSDIGWTLDHEAIFDVWHAHDYQAEKFEDDKIVYYAIPHALRMEEEDDPAYWEYFEGLRDDTTPEEFAREIAGHMVADGLTRDNIPLIVVDAVRTRMPGFVPLVRAIRKEQEYAGFPPVRVVIHEFGKNVRKFELPALTPG